MGLHSLINWTMELGPAILPQEQAIYPFWVDMERLLNIRLSTFTNKTLMESMVCSAQVEVSATLAASRLSEVAMVSVQSTRRGIVKRPSMTTIIRRVELPTITRPTLHQPLRLADRRNPRHLLV